MLINLIWKRDSWSIYFRIVSIHYSLSRKPYFYLAILLIWYQPLNLGAFNKINMCCCLYLLYTGGKRSMRNFSYITREQATIWCDDDDDDDDDNVRRLLDQHA